MYEFRYTVDGEIGSVALDEENDLHHLAVTAEKAVLAAVRAKGLEVESRDVQYMQSRIATAIVRDLLSKEFVDLGEIKVKKE